MSIGTSSDMNNHGGTEELENEIDTELDAEETEGDLEGETEDKFGSALPSDVQIEKMMLGALNFNEEEDDSKLDEIDNILVLPDDLFPKFTLAKNKARFLRMVSWYRQKEEWIEVAPVSGVTKLFKQQTKELEGIRSSKLDYEMELETGTLTPSQRSYRRDELKMCRVQEKMAVHLISKLQVKIKSGRR